MPGVSYAWQNAIIGEHSSGEPQQEQPVLNDSRAIGESPLHGFLLVFVYSCCSATIGSTLIALTAGNRLASRETATKKQEIPANDHRRAHHTDTGSLAPNRPEFILPILARLPLPTDPRVGHSERNAQVRSIRP